MKFGGAAVATPEGFAHVADIIISRKKKYSRVVVVVSAMGDTTDELLTLARQVHPSPPRREVDMLISVGERVSISLLAMALSLRGQEGISLTGSQSGILTSIDHSDARILSMRPGRLIKHLNEGQIVIVAGFQGVSSSGEITTLGRGGSDTSAVALGVCLQADKVEFFKDVGGIYSKDPKSDESAVKFSLLDYPEALNLIEEGAEILHARAVKLAEKNALPLHVLSFKSFNEEGTVIASEKRREVALLPIYESGE
jgi:aspartate kinase